MIWETDWLVEAPPKMSVVNIRMVNGKRPKYDVYIGRALNYPKATFPESKWHNPFTVKQYGLEASLKLFEIYMKKSPELMNSLHELKGKILGCWCKPKVCHGDVLIKLLKGM